MASDKKRLETMFFLAGLAAGILLIASTLHLPGLDISIQLNVTVSTPVDEGRDS